MSVSMSRRWIVALAITLISALTGCGGNSHLNSAPRDAQQPAASAPAAQTTPGAAPAELPPPSSLLNKLPGPDAAQPRGASYLESDLQQPGAAFIPALPRQHELAGPLGAELYPNYSGASGSFADLAFVTYAFSAAGYDRSPQVRLEWSTPPADFHSAWIALARWDAFRWDWYQCTADGRINLPSITPYFNIVGQLLCVVLRTGTDTSTLGSIRLGAPGPVVSLLATPTIGSVPLNVSLDASGSTAGEGTITKYEWDLDSDGVFETDSGLTATENAVLTDNGVWTLAVRVSNSSGSKSIASQDVSAIGPWQHTWGLSNVDQMVDATSDAAGNIYAVGYTRAPSGPFNYDLLLMEWGPAGWLIWARRWDGSINDFGQHVALDANGDLIVTGATEATGDRQVLVQKWNTDGQLLWSRCFGGAGYDSASGMFVDGTDIYTGGTTNGWSLAQDLFAGKLATDGSLAWAKARDHGEADYGTDVAPMNSFFGPTDFIVLGEAYSAGVPNIWRVEYALDGTFEGGYEFGTTANPKTDGQIRYWYDFLGGVGYYYLSGARTLGADTELFFSCNDDTGASVYGTRWWNVSAPTVTDMRVDGLGNTVVCGHMPGFEVGSKYGMLWKFDSDNGDFLACEYWANGSVQVRLHSLESYYGGLLVSGYGTDASGSWTALAGSTGTFSDTWSSVDGTGGDLGWATVDATGTVTDVTADGTLDTGAGSDDALLLYRSAL